MVGALRRSAGDGLGPGESADERRGVRDDARPDDDPDLTVDHQAAIDTPGPEGSVTQTGSVLGTPAYMAPEQAGGEIRKLDARSDVFGLGAILCQVLTGQPPYEGKDANEVRLQAVRGEMAGARARLDSCGAEPDLVALCKRCLAFTRRNRPADGRAVAAAVAAIRQAAEERARQAELDREAPRARSNGGGWRCGPARPSWWCSWPG